ncbi:RecD like protein [Ralstonia phage phiRSL1]|uniref:RecD like protein n=1 Tax=Ralstonia phage phiRSL1 TaxID=1980924 RepID=B2ZYA4_9CAUD|nr:Dda-like helicase [Ralstonia phage phiRSL1]BAG41737.1 RecD like protein [Ralstonia phage phiRSL1]
MSDHSSRPRAWGKQQAEALDLITQWIFKHVRHRPTFDTHKQIFRLFGYAGTGKSTLAQEIAARVADIGGTVQFAAFTGKAASELIKKGCRGASTIHSLIYKAVTDPQTGRVVDYVLNPESILRHTNLLIVDEVSMVNEDQGNDLLSFGVPILVLGDPGQLPPVLGTGFFVQATADFMLTEVHRTAADSPILMLATKARLGEEIKPGRYGSCLVLDTDQDLPDQWLLGADQVLCGTNATRHSLNRKIRKLNGMAQIHPQYPVRGERLVCRRNNKTRGLLNGTLWKCSQPVEAPVKALDNWRDVRNGAPPVWRNTEVRGLHFKVKSHDILDATGKPLVVDQIQTSCHLFNQSLPEPQWKDIASTEEFDFGWCLSVHVAQGSEWENLVVYDESRVFREYRRHHLYTALTRASNSLLLRLG